MPMADRLEFDLLEFLLTNTVGASSSLQLLGSGVVPTPTADELYISLHTAAPAEDEATALTSQSSMEVSSGVYTGYQRVAVTRAGGSWDVSGSTADPLLNVFSNNAPISFAVNGGSTVTVTHFGIGTEPSGAGTLMFWGPLGVSNSRPFVVESGTGNVISLASHGFVADTQVVFYRTIGSPLPTGITQGTVYYVRSAPNTSDFQISSAAGDFDTVAITSTGGGRCQAIVSKQIDNGDSLEFGAQALSIELD